MIDFSVVVLPAPLRPSSVTTSPRRTSNSTPCRMCDSPYQACSPRTASSAPLAPPSDMALAEVRLDDIGVARDLRVIAFGEDLAAREYRDELAQVRDHRQVVLDHEHGAVPGDLADECRYALDVFVRHARGRLVQQHHFGI